MISMKRFDRESSRRNTLMVLWCVGILFVGVSVGTAIQTGRRSAFMVPVIAIGISILIAVFATHRNFFYATTFATVPMTSLMIPGVKLPLNEVMLTSALLLAVSQNPGNLRRLPIFAKVTAAALLGMMIISAAIASGFDLPTTKRLGHMALFCGLYLAIAAGLFPLRSIQKGLLVGVSLASVTGIIYLVAGIAPNGYDGRLTGLFFADPNPAALMILALGMVSIEIVPAGGRRISVIALLFVPFLLTQSRGALIGLGFCVAWWFLGRRLRPGAGLSLLGITVVIVSVLKETVQNIGVFSSRSGSDVLRGQILSKSFESARTNFWFGDGPGFNVLSVFSQYDYFFHNSYLAVISEGGIVSAIAIITLLIMTLIRMIALPSTLRNPWFEMAIISILVIAFHLGEVLLDLPAAIVVGFCLYWIDRPEPRPTQPMRSSARLNGPTGPTNWPRVAPVP
jgi:O-antigen ligase